MKISNYAPYSYADANTLPWPTMCILWPEKKDKHINKIYAKIINHIKRQFGINNT